MMGMMLVCEQCCELEPTGGATNSVFPKVERMLMQIKYQRSLKFVAGSKNMDRYWSMVDYLFCEYFIGYRVDCFKFYKGKGPQLREIEDCETLKYFEMRLVAVLLKAHEAMKQDRELSWKRFRQEMIDELRQEIEARLNAG